MELTSIPKFEKQKSKPHQYPATPKLVMKEDSYKQITAWACLPLLPTHPFCTADHLCSEQEGTAETASSVVQKQHKWKWFLWYSNTWVRLTYGSKYRDYCKGTHFHSALSTRPQRNSLSFLQHCSSFYL